MAWSVEQVDAELSSRSLSYEQRDIEHGQQFKLRTGELVNVFSTGTVSIQGKNRDLAAELRELFDAKAHAPASKTAVKSEVFVV